MRIKRTALAALAAVAGLVLASCGTVSGGGFIESAGDENKKATFGVDIACEDGWLSGTWTYHDRTPGDHMQTGEELDPVRVKGWIPTESEAAELGMGPQFYERYNCGEWNLEPGGEVYLVTPYATQGKSENPMGGFALLSFYDSNENGIPDMDGDAMLIVLSGDLEDLSTGDGDWYYNGGDLLGGNLVTESEQAG